MKTPSLVIASVTLLAATSAQAIDAEYRRLLERSGCTQVTETQGCDINKTKAENAKAGVGSAAHPSGSGETHIAEKACLAKVAKTVGQPSGSLSVTEVLPGEAGIGVTIEVPGATAPWFCLSDAKDLVCMQIDRQDATAPWFCLSDAKGHVDNVFFTGKDGD